MDEPATKKPSELHPKSEIVLTGDGTYEIFGFILDGIYKEDILLYLAKELQMRGLVGEEYGAAVLEREKEYPTGLPTEPVCVAIPHSDKQYVLRSGVAVAKLRNSVVFKNMGAPEEDLDVKLIFLLAVPKDEDKVPMIQAVVEVVQDQEVLLSLLQAETEKELVEIVQKYCNRRG